MTTEHAKQPDRPAMPQGGSGVQLRLASGDGGIVQGEGKVAGGTVRKELSLLKGGTATVTLSGTIDPSSPGP